MKIILIGYMAVGKTRIGKRLAKQLKLPFIDLDDEVLKKNGISAGECIRQYGEDVFRKIERECLLECLKKKQFVLASGGGTPCFYDNLELMNKECTTIFLKTQFERIFQRLDNSVGDRPMALSIDGKIDKKKLKEHYESRLCFYSKAKIIVEKDNLKAIIEDITIGLH